MKRILLSFINLMKSFTAGLVRDKWSLAIKGSLIVLFLMLCIVSCEFISGGRASNPINPALSPDQPVIDDTKLIVVQGTPVGEISHDDLRREIAVVFNHPVVPLAKLEETTRGVFTVSPSLPGAFRWYGSRVCAFIPADRFAPGTAYTVSIPAGLKALNGTKLSDRHSFTFTTPALKVLTHSLIDTKTGYRQYSRTIDYNQGFKLVFNYPVSIADLEKHLTLRSGGTPHPRKLVYVRDENEEEGDTFDREADKKRSVYVFPRGDFGRDADVELFVSKDLKPIGGNRGMDTDQAFTFRTHGPLEITVKNAGVNDYFQDMWNCGIKFNNPVSGNDIAAKITFSPKAVYSGSREGSTRFTDFTDWNLKPGVSYSISIAKNLKDIYGNGIKGETAFTAVMPSYRPSISADWGHWSIEARMSQKIPVYAANLPVISANVGAFDISHVLRSVMDSKYQIASNSTNARVIPWNTGMTENLSGRLAFDYSPYLDKNKRGWLALRLTAMIPDYRGELKEQRIDQFIQSTDLGITLKHGEKAIYAWIHTLTGCEPVRAVRVTAYEGDRFLGKGITNDKGYCAFSIPPIQKQNRLVVLAETTEGISDRAFVTAGEHGVYMYPLADYDSEASAPHLFGQVIYDRKLYRPGDEMSFKAVLAVRESGKLLPFTERHGTVHVTISNAQGSDIFKKHMTPSAEGGVSDTIQIPADAPLGHYNIHIKSGKQKGREIRGIVDDNFQVEEFRPVNFSVETSGLTDAKIGSTLDLVVTGRYLFGAPMQNAGVSVTVRRSPRRIHIPNYGAYFFGDEVILYGRGDAFEYYMNSEGKTGLTGAYSVKVPLTRLQEIEKDGMEISPPYDAEIEARVTDVDDKSVTRTGSFRVYPGDTIIGIETEDYYRHYKQPFKFNIVSLDTAGRPGEAPGAEIIIHRQETKSIQTLGPDGSRQVVNTRTVTKVHSSTMDLSGRPRPFEFRPGKAGVYILTVKDARSPYASRVYFYAFGGDFGGWGMYNEDVVKLIPDRAEYRPGETARVLVQTPFPAARAIVTLERENVIWQKTMTLKSNGEPIQIPIKAEYLPNVYLSVMLLTPRADPPASGAARERFIREDLGAPRFKIGIASLQVNTESRKAKLAVTPDSTTYSPGDKVSLQINTEPGAEVAVSVADRGVLDLIDYHFSNPLRIFYNVWPLGVRAIENRLKLILQLVYAMKGNAPGGGDSDYGSQFGGFPFDSEDGTRKDFRYTAYWNPAVRADAKGKAVISFTLPHNLTTFRVSSFAASGGRYASHETEFQVKRPLVVQPLMPRFIRPGDSLELGAVVINQTGKDRDFRVTIKSPLLSFATGKGDEASRVIRIPSGASREVSFKTELNVPLFAKTRNRPGDPGAVEVKGIISAAASGGGEGRDSMTFTFPVREHPPVEAFAISGFTEKKISEGVKIPSPEEVLGDIGRLEISLASTALTGLGKAFDFYASNPYFCLEQRASAFMLMMTSGKLLKSFNYRAPERGGYDFTRIEELFLRDLRDFQNSDGGFRAWKDDSLQSRSNPYLTAYTADVLRLARENGYSIDTAVYGKALQYLGRYVRRPDADLRSYILETYSLIYHLFALEGQPSGDMETFLLENEPSLSLRARGNLVLGLAHRRRITSLQSDKDARRIMDHFKNSMRITTRSVSLKEERGYHRAFYTEGSSTGVVLRAFLKLDPSNPLIPGMIRHAMNAKTTLWMDSHSAGNLARALWEYHRAYEITDSPFRARALIASRKIAEKRFTEPIDAPAVEKISMKELLTMGKPGELLPLVFEKEGDKGRLYYSAVLQYAPRLAVTGPRDEGIEIKREIFSMTDLGREGIRTKPAETLRRGELYLVRLTVVNPRPSFNFLINDPLPSSLEGVKSGFATESSRMDRFLRDRRVTGATWWWESGSERYEYRDDRVVITRDYLRPGIHEYFYLARALVKGKATAPAARAFLMYEPEVFGRTGGGFMTVE